MKKLIIALMLAGMSASAQDVASTVKLEKVYDLDAKASATESKETGSTAIYHGVSYPVYMTANGKLFIWVVSKKSGKKYKKYIN